MATGAAYIGARVTLAGLSLQFISYGLFCILLVKTHVSIKSGDAFSTYASCRVIIRVLYFSSAFIFVRPPPFWPRSLPLTLHVDSFYLSCRRIFSGTHWLPFHSRRQVPGPGLFPCTTTTYRKYSLPLRHGCIAYALRDRRLYSLVANQVYQAK